MTSEKTATSENTAANETTASETTAIVGCDALTSFIAAAQEAQGTNFPVYLLDRGLHLEPATMQKALLEQIDALDPAIDTVLVCMAFCGGAWDQVVAPRRLVIPRADDCVSILLHTDDAYCPCRKAPWHLYMYEKDPAEFSIEKMMVEVDSENNYGSFSQEQLFHMFFDNYRHVDIIDTGLTDCYSEDYVMRAQEFADGVNAELDYVTGGTRMLEKLVAGAKTRPGCWDQQFIVAEPGELVKHSRFFD